MSNSKTAYEDAFPALGTTKAPVAPAAAKHVAFPINKSNRLSNRDYSTYTHEKVYKPRYNHSAPLKSDEVSGDIAQTESNDKHQVKENKNGGVIIPNLEIDNTHTKSSEPKPSLRFDIATRPVSYSAPKEVRVNSIEEKIEQVKKINETIISNQIRAQAEAEAELERQATSPLAQTVQVPIVTHSAEVNTATTPAQYGARAHRFIHPRPADMEFVWYDTIQNRLQVYAIDATAYYVR